MRQSLPDWKSLASQETVETVRPHRRPPHSPLKRGVDGSRSGGSTKEKCNRQHPVRLVVIGEPLLAGVSFADRDISGGTGGLVSFQISGRLGDCWLGGAVGSPSP